MNEDQIIEIIDRLIGNIEPYGSCHIDNEREKNLSVYIEVAYRMVERLCDISENKDSYMGSVKSMGTLAYENLEYIKDLINNYISNDANEEI